MDVKLKDAIMRAVEKEPLARQFSMELVALETGRSVVEMTYDPSSMNNLYHRAHGGALYALIDEAFETAGQTHGTIAVAMNVNVTYMASPVPGTRLRAEAEEIKRTKHTAAYDINVFDENRQLLATCQALAFRTGKPIPFI
ncbi:MAG: PaaI family thioesterase [Thermodesulfobacteriota bacterium]